MQHIGKGGRVAVFRRIPGSFKGPVTELAESHFRCPLRQPEHFICECVQDGGPVARRQLGVHRRGA
jgi:hypothetical protein